MSDKVLVFTQVKLETATLQASLLPCFVALLTPYRFKKLCYKKYNIQRHFTDQDLNFLRMSGVWMDVASFCKEEYMSASASAS